MRIAFDVDDTILEHPKLFSVLSNALKGAGHQVYVLTDFDEHFRQHRVDELKKIGIAYDELIITPDKQAAMKERGIEFVFDDDASYYSELKCVPIFIAGNVE